MVTGDNLVTANAIARECRIINEEITRSRTHEEYIIMEGPKFF